MCECARERQRQRDRDRTRRDGERSADKEIKILRKITDLGKPQKKVLF